jgi:hypothetical protein
MKKTTIIGFSLVLLIIVGLLFRHHFKHPSDAAIRQKLPGIWSFTVNGGRSTMTIDSDGHYSSQFTGKDVFKLEGIWHIEDGCFVYTVTNSSWAPTHVPYTISERVISIDAHELVVQEDREKQAVYQKTQP